MIGPFSQPGSILTQATVLFIWIMICLDLRNISHNSIVCKCAIYFDTLACSSKRWNMDAGSIECDESSFSPSFTIRCLGFSSHCFAVSIKPSKSGNEHCWLLSSKKKNMYWKCAGIFISRCQLWYSKIHCWKTILQYLFLYTPEIHCSAPPFFVSYQCSFIMDSLITLFYAITPMNFVNVHVACCMSALHHCSKIDFPRLSHHRMQEVLVAMAQRECYVLTNTAQWHLAKSVVAVWTAPRICRHACMCPRSCNFSCPLNVPLPPSICLLADGRMICTVGSWEISFRGLMKHSPILNRSSNSDFFKASTSPNIISAGNKY